MARLENHPKTHNPLIAVIALLDNFVEGWLKAHIPLLYRLVMWHSNWMSRPVTGDGRTAIWLAGTLVTIILLM